MFIVLVTIIFLIQYILSQRTNIIILIIEFIEPMDEKFISF